ncbi:hypothetical protein Slin15195_G050660 [Septoria linicola]|uniref:Uncharacterized protein n=1 Tax=Septoria linicola TaxID=215465 RepID=A0A9Q9ATJ5_9PEZI|nr:hypothetical protein Slin15195_G050660 [Septoria linicola]
MDSAMHFEMLESTIDTMEQLLISNDARQSGEGCSVSDVEMSTATANIAKFDNVWETPMSEMTTAQLLLAYVRCYAEMTLHSSLLNHLGTPTAPRRDRNVAVSSTNRCIEAAIKAGELADTLQGLGELHEARCLTIEVLAFAAMTLIVLGASRVHEHAVAFSARQALDNSTPLLAILSQHSSIAQQCLDSVQPLYIALGPETGVKQSLTGLAPL